MLLQKLIAKKSKDGKTTSLYDHSMAVADRCLELFDMLGINDPKLRYLCNVCGLLHDIGKCSKEFQKHIKKDDGKYVYHNVLGYFIIKELLDMGEYSELASKVVLYHHPIDWNSDRQLSKVNITDYSDVLREYVEIIRVEYADKTDISIKDYAEDVALSLGSARYYIEEINSKHNVYLHIISNIVKFADYIVSKGYDCKKLITRKNGLNIGEIRKPEGYDDRFEKQVSYSEDLGKYNLSIFESETGFGKTMLGLLYALKTSDRKVYWVCPRNSIAEGVYERLTDELCKLKLSSKISTALLLTNEWKGSEEADIVVTNIDNFLRPVIKNDALARTYDMLFSTVIFDEFHEYVDTSSLMAFFNIMVKSRGITNSKTLCLSATPIYGLIPSNPKKDNIITHKDETISKRKYKLRFCENLDGIGTKGNGYLICVNATKTAQYMVKNGKADKTIHSRFFKADVADRLEEVMKEYGKSNKGKPKSTTWSATNIISTGMDISFDNIIIKSPIPNRFIQSIGRCNRWSDGNNCHEVIICPCTLEGNDSSERYSLKVQKSLYSISKHLYKKLKETIKENEEIEFGELYKINKEFIKCDTDYKKYLSKTLAESYKNLQSYVRYKFAYKNNDSEELLLSNNCLRKKDDKTVKFYVKFPGYSELYEGDNIVFNFDEFFKKHGDNIKYSLNKRLRKKYKKYFDNKYKPDKIENVIDYFLNLARSPKYPFPMIDIYEYDKALGVKIMDKYE